MPRTLPLLALLLATTWWAVPSSAEDDGMEFFEAKIRPVLVERCNRCHSDGGKAPKGGLRLDSSAGLRKGGDSGPVIAPGKVEESPLIDAIAHEGGVAEMPPQGKLPDPVIADFRRWVEMGAPLPEDKAAGSAANRAAIDFAQGRKFWSFLPAVAQSAAFGFRSAMAEKPDRCVRPERARRPRDEAFARGRSPHADPPCELRPDRPFADSRGGRGVRLRPFRRRL